MACRSWSGDFRGYPGFSHGPAYVNTVIEPLIVVYDQVPNELASYYKPLVLYTVQRIVGSRTLVSVGVYS